MSAELVVDRLLGEEGGIADVGDGQGTTYFGQTEGWLARHHLQAPLTREDAAANYRLWLRERRLLEVCEANDVLGTLVVDWEINSGDGVGVKHLQQLLGVIADGVIGEKTLAALNGLQHSHALAVGLVAARSRFYGDVLHHTPADVKFAHSWLHRLADMIDLL